MQRRSQSIYRRGLIAPSVVLAVTSLLQSPREPVCFEASQPDRRQRPRIPRGFAICRVRDPPCPRSLNTQRHAHDRA